MQAMQVFAKAVTYNLNMDLVCHLMYSFYWCVSFVVISHNKLQKLEGVKNSEDDLRKEKSVFSLAATTSTEKEQSHEAILVSR